MIVISKADLSKINNVGQLYDAVFEELKERNYNPDEESFRQTHGINRKISDKLARQIAIEISYEMYKANTQLLKINSEQLKNALNEAFEKEWRLREADKEQIEQSEDQKRHTKRKEIGVHQRIVAVCACFRQNRHTQHGRNCHQKKAAQFNQAYKQKLSFYHVSFCNREEGGKNDIV